MKTFDEWCKWFADIEKDPTAPVVGVTLRTLLLARVHLAECQPCSDSYDRVMAKAPPEDPRPRIGFN